MTKKEETQEPEDEPLSEIVPAELEGEVPEELKELLNKVGNQEAVLKLIAYSERYSGVIPHPRLMAQFKETMADAPERIFKMAEDQQQHRMYLEKKVVDSDTHRADTGLVLGFVLLFTFAVGGIALLFYGKDIQGYVTIATGLVSGVGNFIRVGSERAKEMKEQAKRKKKNSITNFIKKKTTKSPS